MSKSLFSILFIVFFFKTCDQSEAGKMPHVEAPPKTQMLKGLSFVAPPRAFTNNPMEEVQSVNANWIAVIPYAYTRTGEAKVYFNTDRQWWGERVEGVEKTIEIAKAANINIVMKPQVYIPGSWTGNLDYENKADWEAWEADYTKYIMTFTRLAVKYDVPVICIGTEFKIGAKKREQYWRKLIKEIRSIYTGKLIYAANWDEYMDVPFWDALDYVGINAYFPLLNKKTPSIEELKKAWTPHVKAIRHFYNKVKKPIIFSEYGYLSVDGCAFNTWELEGKIRNLAINEQAQANAINALLDTFWEEPYWHGGFIWKWFPNMKGGEGYNAKDYTPQGKTGHTTLKDWYGKTIEMD